MAMPEPQPKRRAQEQQKAPETQAQTGPEWQPVGEASASYGDFDVAYAPEPEPGAGVGGSGGIGVRSGGGGTTRGEGQSMSAVMDELLGSDTGVPLGSLGSACAQVADAMAQGTEQSFLAGVFWWLFTKSQAYLDTASRLGAGTNARPVVVRHAEGTRFDLLLLDPQHGDDDWSAVRLDPFQTSFGMASPDVSEERLSGVLRRAELADAVAPATLLESARELAASSQFGVAVVTAPEEIPTCAVWPAVGVHAVNEDEPVATLGAYFGDEDAMATDTCIATTVDHALANGWQGLTVDGAPLDIIGRHYESDSCVLRVKTTLLDGRQRSGLRGPLLTVPTQLRPASFYGAKSGLTEVHFLNWDPSIVDPSADEVVRVYTEADTRVGDSGAALIDENDFIVGFARGRTGSKAIIHYSYWTYALTVYLAHGLLDRVALGA
jgi:hypothetical protein